MKTKKMLLGICALLLAGGGWFARAAWRAHKQIVTLDVREMPLAAVLQKIEWQTWQKIHAEQALDARITLHVKDKPLAQVLDRIAEQAGARWTTLYAVYGSKTGLTALESALKGDGKLEPAGWKQITPVMPDMADEPPEGGAFPPPQNPPPGGGPPRMMFVRKFAGPGGGASEVIQSGSGDKVEIWSPETLVAESALSEKLKSKPGAMASAGAAEKAACKVHGKWAKYLAFHKSSMGVGFGGPPPPGKEFDPMKRNPNDRFARLTPRQRVERARSRGGMMDIEDKKVVK